MKHADVKRNLADYLEGDLDLETRAVVDSHLAHCETCARHVREMQQTIQLLRRLPEPETPPMIAADVMRRIRAGETRPGFFERLHGRLVAILEPSFVLPASAMAAAALVVVVLQSPDSLESFGLRMTDGDAVGPRWADSGRTGPTFEASAPLTPRFSDDPGATGSLYSVRDAPPRIHLQLEARPARGHGGRPRVARESMATARVQPESVARMTATLGRESAETRAHGPTSAAAAEDGAGFAAVRAEPALPLETTGPFLSDAAVSRSTEGGLAGGLLGSLSAEERRAADRLLRSAPAKSLHSPRARASRRPDGAAGAGAGVGAQHARARIASAAAGSVSDAGAATARIPIRGDADARDVWLARALESPIDFARFIADKTLAEQELWVAQLARRAEARGLLDEVLRSLERSGDATASWLADDFESQALRLRDRSGDSAARPSADR